MLPLDDRTLYSQCLRPPSGYRFDAGVATTYSLDLAGLLAFPVSLVSAVDLDPDELLANPVELLDAVRKVMGRLTVFVQQTRVVPPDRGSPLFGLVEDAYFEARAPNGGAFHPKLWLLRYTHEGDGTVLLRALVLSRNLTFDRSWDVVVSLEGTPNANRTVKASAGLSELVAMLPELTTTLVPATRRRSIRELADEVGRTVFTPPEDLAKYPPAFEVIGLGHRRWAPDVHGREVLVVSPFVKKTALDRVRALCTGPHARLLSRDLALNELGAAGREGWACFTASDEAVAAEDDATGSAGVVDAGLRGLHAKAYCVESGAEATWWLGSANCTAAAFDGRNVELMVRLTGHRKQVGIERFWEAVKDRLAVAYVAPGEEPVTDPTRDAVEVAEKAAEVVHSAALELECSPVTAEFDLVLRGRLELPPELDEVDVRAWPVTLSASAARDLVVSDAPNTIVFPTLSVAQLTCQIAFAVTARVKDVACTLRFVRKLKTTGFPDDRASHVLRAVIGDRAAFLQFLRCQLGAFEGVEGLFNRARRRSKRDGPGGGDGGDSPEFAVLEELLPLVRRHPERIHALDEVVKALRATPETAAVVPDEFSTMWQTIAVYAERQSDKGRTSK